jgi:hypothetical protein
MQPWCTVRSVANVFKGTTNIRSPSSKPVVWMYIPPHFNHYKLLTTGFKIFQYTMWYCRWQVHNAPAKYIVSWSQDQITTFVKTPVLLHSLSYFKLTLQAEHTQSVKTHWKISQTISSHGMTFSLKVKGCLANSTHKYIHTLQII